MSNNAAIPTARVVALSGGIGGAKLVRGLSRILSDDELLIVANTGDDFTHLGLAICPDLDTLIYTLSGLADPDRGWGRAGESWAFMDALAAIGGETWFRLGDRDLALHIERTRRLDGGETLSGVMADIGERLGARHRVVPMSDEPVRTIVHSDEGVLDFQDYFVRRQARPRVERFSYQGAETARPQTDFLTALEDPSLEAVIICPSNPYLSVDPILSMDDIRAALDHTTAPVVAVTPIVDGQALKGPTAKIMIEMGLDVSAAAVAAHYRPLIDGFVLDDCDRNQIAGIEASGIACHVTSTIMATENDKMALADQVLRFASELGRTGRLAANG